MQTELQRNLHRLLTASDFNMKSLARAAGIGDTGVRDILTGRARKPQYATLQKIADVLKCTVDDLTGRVTSPSVAENPLTVVVSRPQFAPQPDFIPIKGGARGGADQEMFLRDGPIGQTRRPSNLAGVPDAYALYMVGDSMSPRYEPGWLLHVHPHKPPRLGRDVVVVKPNDAVIVKTFVRRDDHELVLRQLNPPAEIRIPVSEVMQIHLVVGADQEG